MDPYVFFLIVIALIGGAFVYMNNMQHATYAAILSKLGVTPAPNVTHTVNVTPANPPTNAADPSSSIWPLDPAKAASMSQNEVYNAYYANYLRSLSKAAMDAWQSAYVKAAAPPPNADGSVVTGGAWAYDPFGVEVAGQAVHVLPGTSGGMVLVTDAAQSNLVQLARLGAPVVNGIPGQ